MTFGNISPLPFVSCGTNELNAFITDDRYFSKEHNYETTHNQQNYIATNTGADLAMMFHDLLYTRPNIFPTENRVGYFDTICNQTKLLSVFSSMSRIRGKEFTFFEKILGEIWAPPTFWC